MLLLTLHSLLITYQYINQLYYIIHILLLCFLCIFTSFSFGFVFIRDFLLKVELPFCTFLYLFALCILVFFLEMGVLELVRVSSVPGNAFLDDLILRIFSSLNIFLASPNPSLSIHHQSCIKGLSHPERENYAYKHTSFFIHGLFFLEPSQASQLISIAVSPKNKTSSFISISAWNPKEIFYS
jgi:hypothetical protein